MKTGERVRFRSGLQIADQISIPRDASGTVVCSYHLLADKSRRCERLDVDFRPYGILWGQPAEAFEPTLEGQSG